MPAAMVRPKGRGSRRDCNETGGHDPAATGFRQQRRQQSDGGNQGNHADTAGGRMMAQLPLHADKRPDVQGNVQ